MLLWSCPCSSLDSSISMGIITILSESRGSNRARYFLSQSEVPAVLASASRRGSRFKKKFQVFAQEFWLSLLRAAAHVCAGIWSHV